jgi:farnesyl diphosphate synthase
MGAVLADTGDADRRRLADYGRRLGLAFQIADDLLDAESSTEALGKAAAKDAGRGKATLVALLGKAHARAALDAAVAECEALLAPFGPCAEPLRAAARFAATRSR